MDEAHDPADPNREAEPEPQRWAPPSTSQPQQNQPSWMAYSNPMSGVQDGYNPQLHEHYWEGQLEAAKRGSLHWGFPAFFIGYGGYYLFSFVLAAVLAGQFRNFDPADPPKLGPILVLIFAPNILLGLVPAFFSWWKGQGLRKDYGILPTWRDAVVGVACGGAAFGSAYVLGLLLVSLTDEEQRQGGLESTLLQAEGKTIWLFLFALFAFLGAPLTEELLMRGALWGALEHYKVPRYAILLITALLFAFIHQEPWRMPILFAGGVAMGVARMITGRVASSMIAHATNNLLPALVIFFSVN